MPQNPEKSKAAFCSWPTILIFSVTRQIIQIYPTTLLLGTYFSPDSIFLAHSVHLGFFAFHVINPAHSLSVIKTDTGPDFLPVGDLSCGDPLQLPAAATLIPDINLPPFTSGTENNISLWKPHPLPRQKGLEITPLAALVCCVCICSPAGRFAARNVSGTDPAAAPDRAPRRRRCDVRHAGCPRVAGCAGRESTYLQG